ncbi:MAG: hypothetical protein DRO88_08825 [Promethearchaeia archaeon]|nr:MAG: hypothetical protein DRO88_08825 [Candidatus Lokiarchaeia archaeon]
MTPKLLPESIVLYLDLSTGILSKKMLQKGIEQFVKDKIKKIPNCTFSCFYFLKDTTPFLSEEFKDFKSIKNQINSDWKNRESSQSNFENGLFYCLSFLAQKAAQKAGNYRVIVITDSPSQKSSEYAEALMELVETVKNFPTFIDIIRVGGKERYSDDVKLRIISTLTSGGLFYAQNDKDFLGKFVALAKNKILPDLRAEGGQEIDPEKKLYYENVAKMLQPAEANVGPCLICGKDLCEYCTLPEDKLVCPLCNQPYHECCAALYTWKKNIGLKHIFRCVNCEGLVKMNERRVYEINGEPYPGDESPHLEETAELEGEETWNPETDMTTSSEAEEPAKIEEEKSKEESVKVPETSSNGEVKQIGKVKVKRGLFGFQPIGMADDEEESNKPESTTAEKEQEPKMTEEEKLALARKKLAERRKKKKVKNGIRICKVCSHHLKPDERICPKCGSPAF